MKFALHTFGILLFSIASVANAGLIFQKDAFQVGEEVYTDSAVPECPAGYEYRVFGNDNDTPAEGGGSCGEPAGVPSYSTNLGIYKFMAVIDGTCFTYNECKDLYPTLDAFVLYDEQSISTYIEIGRLGAFRSSGYNAEAITLWAGENFFLLFIGSGLGVLYALRYWIVALVTIGAIVYFTYRGFRLYNHARRRGELF